METTEIQRGGTVGDVKEEGTGDKMYREMMRTKTRSSKE